MTSREHEEGVTPDRIAKLVLDLGTLRSTLDRWAIQHEEKIPRRAASRLAQYRTLLSATIADLRGSLRQYDPKLAAALKEREST